MPARRRSPPQRLLAAFLLCLAALLGAALLPWFFLPSVAFADLAAASILMGLLWMLVGWFLAPSVETYVGQGAMKGFPIIGPTFANPERNPAVMTDLADRMSRQTDLGILSAGLGLALIALGVAFYTVPMVGFAAGSVGVGAVLVLLWRASPRLARPNDPPVHPPSEP